MARLLEAFVSRSTLFVFCLVGIVVTAIAGAVRIYVRLTTQRRLYLDDHALLFALLLYFILAGLYIGDLAPMYEFLDVISGNVEYTPAVNEEFHDVRIILYEKMMMYNFAVTPLYWAVLWAVKISLLLFFRRVIKRTNWMRPWWIIFGATVLTFVGCVISQFTSCSSVADFTVLGACYKPENQRAQIISLYYSFAADVLTDVAIMALPVRVILSLQMTTRDKLSLVALFSTNIIAVVLSMIRVFLIWAKTGSASPSPAWLALWALVGSMVSIICGCVPGISQLFRTPTHPVKYVQARSSSIPSGNNCKLEKSRVFAGSGTSRASASRSATLEMETASRGERFHYGRAEILAKTEIEITSETADGFLTPNRRGL